MSHVWCECGVGRNEMSCVWCECGVGRDKMERGVLRCGKSQHSSLGVVWWSGFISYYGGGGVFSRGFLWLGRLCFRWGRGNIGGNSGRV